MSGCRELAAEFCDKIIDNAMKRGLNEFYHCDTGEPLGVPDLNTPAKLAAGAR